MPSFLNDESTTITIEDIEYHEKKLNMVFPDELKALYLGDVHTNWKKHIRLSSNELQDSYPHDDAMWNDHAKERALTRTKSLLFKDSKGDLRSFDNFFSLFDDKLDIQKSFRCDGYDQPPYLIPFANSLNDFITIHRETKQIFLFRVTIVERNDAWSLEEYYQANSVLIAESFAEFIASISWIEGVACFGDRGQVTCFLDGNALWEKAVSMRLRPDIPLVLEWSAQSISEEEIALIEKQLNVCFPKELKKLYLQYNGGYPNKEIWIDPKGLYHDESCRGSFFIPMLHRNCQDENEEDYRLTMKSFAQFLWSQDFLPKENIPIFLQYSYGYSFENKAEVTRNIHCLSLKDEKMYLYAARTTYTCKEKDIPSILESKESIPFTYERELASSFEEYLNHFTDDYNEFSSLVDIEDPYIYTLPSKVLSS